MRKPKSMKALEDLGRTRLSHSFYFRDFLFSEIAGFYGMTNIPENPDVAIRYGKQLCQALLEPLQATFGRIGVRSGYRAKNVTEFGNSHLGRGSVKSNRAYHIWDLSDDTGFGAGASIVIPWFADRYNDGADWRSLAWWIHDNLPYSHLEFYPKLCAFNIQWHEKPWRRIDSFIQPRGCLTKSGMQNNTGTHSEWYPDFPELQDAIVHQG